MPLVSGSLSSGVTCSASAVIAAAGTSQCRALPKHPAILQGAILAPLLPDPMLSAELRAAVWANIAIQWPPSPPASPISRPAHRRRWHSLQRLSRPGVTCLRHAVASRNKEMLSRLKHPRTETLTVSPGGCPGALPPHPENKSHPVPAGTIPTEPNMLFCAARCPLGTGRPVQLTLLLEQLLVWDREPTLVGGSKIQLNALKKN